MVLFSVALLVVALSPARAHACGCPGVGSPCEALGGAASVFVGTVVSIKEGARSLKAGGGGYDFTPRVVRFTLEQPFIGVEAAEVEVTTGLGGLDCGYPFECGATYLVYTYRSEKDERVHTSTCSRTKPVARADEDLAFLRGQSGAAAGVTIYGSVMRRLSYPGPDRVRASVPMEGAALSVEGAGLTREARADSHGRFQFAGLSPGEYKLRLRLPDDLVAYKPERVVKVEPRGCASEVFYVSDNGRLSGRIYDPEGKPVAGLGVVIVDAKGTNLEMTGDGVYSKTDEEGRYKFSGLPAGEYVLGINIRGRMRVSAPSEQAKDYVCKNCVQIVEFVEPDELTSAYPRLFYPGVPRVAQAEHVYVSPGQEIRDFDWRVPPRRAEALVRGRVVWDDGKPAAGADVLYRDATYEDLIVYNYAVRADERGEFSFKAYRGGRYIVEAVSDAPDPPGWRGPGPAEYRVPSTVVVNAPSVEMTVVIARRKNDAPLKR